MKNPKLILSLLLTLVCSACFQTVAGGHGTEVPNSIALSARYSTGTPINKAVAFARSLDTNNQQVYQGISDSTGLIQINAPQGLYSISLSYLKDTLMISHLDTQSTNARFTSNNPQIVNLKDSVILVNPGLTLVLPWDSVENNLSAATWDSVGVFTMLDSALHKGIKHIGIQMKSSNDTPNVRQGNINAKDSLAFGFLALQNLRILLNHLNANHQDLTLILPNYIHFYAWQRLNSPNIDADTLTSLSLFLDSLGVQSAISKIEIDPISGANFNALGLAQSSAFTLEMTRLFNKKQNSSLQIASNAIWSIGTFNQLGVFWNNHPSVAGYPSSYAMVYTTTDSTRFNPYIFPAEQYLSGLALFIRAQAYNGSTPLFYRMQAQQWFVNSHYAGLELTFDAVSEWNALLQVLP